MPAANAAEERVTSSIAAPSADQSGFSSVRIYGATFATEFFVMVVQVVLYKFAAAWLGQTGFSEYAVARRVLAFLQPIILLGFGVGLPRYIALADGRGESSRSSQYLSATLLCVGGFTALIAGAFVVWPGWFAYLFFGSAAHSYLLLPLALMLVGMLFHCVLYAYLRGKLAVGRANTLQLINNGLLPVIVFIFFHKQVAGLLWYLGLAWITSTGIMFLLTPSARGWKNPAKETRELLSYGLQRLPGDFGFTALLALPAIFTAHLSGIKEAGFVAFGLTVVNMIASVFSPIGIVLLPKVSRAVGSKDFEVVRREIVFIRRMVVVVSGTLVIVIELLGGRLIRAYLGADYAPAAAIVNVLVVGGLPLAFFSALRSAIDACYHRAVNALNVLPTVIFFLVGSSIGALAGSSKPVLWSFSGALTLLAVLTQYQVHKILTLPRAIAPCAAPIGVAETPEGLA